MRVLSLVNEYPKVTHTFVRTEITTLEQNGIEIERVSIRRHAPALPDPADRREAQRTRVVLDIGRPGLARALARSATAEPRRFPAALRMAVRLGRLSQRGVAYHLAYLAEACVLRGWYGQRIDHVHAHFGTNPAAVALLWRLLGGPPYSFTVHGPEEFTSAVAASLADKVAHAQFVVAVCEAGRSHLQQICPPPTWDRIQVVRCGIGTGFHGQPAAVPEQRRLVFVGRLCAEKAPLLLIEAAARLCDEADFTLTMIGDGPLRLAAEMLRQARGLTSRVQLRGWAGSEDVRREILAARALVLPSFAEGLPVALMEALALHRPVITTPVGGIAELVEDRVNGWLVAPGQLEALASAMRAALNAAPSALEEMGARGAERVRAQHDARIEGCKLAALLRSSRR
jgi:glycosyltransferase involved in cell wall biosynthesis